ncbi:uncharacterized protein LOC104901545 isoform X1 [Beta vulgaris subsp. vulgaris]|uniref:uncharacterized protein LOC104901545 isoform X1 n=1 Tax=Beta vulgaris subsp. vulgaris TaxID=3555 RepID=UPI0020373704|nr:uncharacterized protein LOC104901545 isoform X1 [Beta vulgaris subsp. vulgaris]
MQHCESKKSRAEAATSILIPFFKPRQVILNSNSNMKHTKSPISLSSEQRILLLQSICQFFEQSGFSKTLKQLYKEADIQKESWKSCLINLEEMCYQYLKMQDDTKLSESAVKEQLTKQKDGSVNDVASVENGKKTKENEGDKGKKSPSKVEEHSGDGVDVKPKKKKKSKSVSDPSEQVAVETDSKPSQNPEDVSMSIPSEPVKKSKDKKKKKHKDHSEEEEEKEDTQVKLAKLPAEETLDKPDADLQEEKKEKSKSRKKKEDTLNSNDLLVETIEADKEKKVSKKRKKFSSEENESICVDNAASDDSKRRKTDDLDQQNGTILPKTPNGAVNGFLEKDEGKELEKKDKSRQYNDLSELYTTLDILRVASNSFPKLRFMMSIAWRLWQRTSAKAFRRVKEEEVEFVDERLQDNSYWAKDGADSGYGAKAQEVLGQVRGRDFRHEKTKKKRGSYRGGQIDLQSHSIKFNYDNDDE